ncbi:MAG: two-component regulator propeller domain-containing protein [Chitinophagaceae bacterium]
MLYRIAVLFLLLQLTGLPQTFATDLPVKYLGIEQGLSNNAVTCIYQDYRGFMWFGTYDGLNRYDGYTFKIFRNILGDNTSINSNNIYAIEGDTRHNIWVGVQNGLSIFNPATSAFSSPRYTDIYGSAQDIQDEVHVVKSIGNGHMLVGTRQNGLLIFESNTSKGTQIALTGANTGHYNVTAIEFDQQRQSAWVFVRQYGLFLYDIKNRKLTPVSNTITQANCLKIDQGGNLWIGSETGLYHFNTTTGHFSQNLMPSRINVVRFCQDRQQIMWIATDGEGVWSLPPGASQPQPFVTANGTSVVNSNAIYAIYEDANERKWIGTLRGGINMVEAKPLPFKKITYGSADRNSNVDNFILSFCEDQPQRIWIGTDGAGLRYWNRSNNTYTEYKNNPADKNSLSSNFITSIIKDQYNDTWISTWSGGVNRLRRNSRSFERYTFKNPATGAEEQNAWLVYEDAQKNLWASTTNDGSLYLLNRSTNHFDLFDPAIVNLQSLAEDRSGNLWGGNYTSLILIDRNTKKHRFYNIGYPVRSIHQDRNDNLWLGTQGAGLLLFNRSGQYKSFTTADGLPGNTILRMLEDNKGNLWLSTYNGLCMFNPSTRICRNFSTTDGLQSNQFSFNAALTLSSGEFLFGGIKGFNIFSPDSINEQKSTPGIFLTGLKINNRSIDEDSSYPITMNQDIISQVVLPFDKAMVSLDFVALNYSGTDKIKYAYFLQGWDKDWNYISNLRTANYSRLQEGNYVFKVKATRPDGIWSNETKLLTITVLPPWYRTWWAYLTYLLCAAGIIYLYIRYTRRQERLRYEIKLAHLENEKDKELTEKKLSFFTNISHEFRTPLSLIINPLKEKLNHADNNNTDPELTIAYRNARRLLSLVDQLLLFRKADSDEDVLKISKTDIADLSKGVYQCFLQQAKTKQIDYQLITPGKPLMVHVDNEKIEIALFNLLSNAFKYTPNNGAITVEVQENMNEVLVSVKDNGCGIDEEAQKKIFEKFGQADQPAVRKAGFGIGLYLVKHFTEEHRGSVTCKSTLNKGTTFTISLPKGTAHLPENYIQCDNTTTTHELLEELAIEPEQQLTVQVADITAGQGKAVEEVITGKKSILLIDDSAEIREYLQHLFQKQYLLYVADNGTDGFALAAEHIPDLIISDINMKGMDGVELCQAIKQSENLGHIPVILLTGSTAQETKLRGIEGGADDYITKPFDQELLVARVESILRNRNLLQRYFFDNITLKETTIKVPAEYQEFLRKCIRVIEENLDTDDFTIKKFSKAMGMSHSGLYQKVKAISGQSLNAFIRSIRLRRAAVLMLTEGMNVNQSATQVGIGDVRYFREQFVKLFGITPSEYIKKYRSSFNNSLNTIKTKETNEL